MASASDWWARALGRPAPPAPPPSGSTAAPPYGARPSYAAPPGVPPPQQQGYTTYDANTGAQVADDGHVAMLINAAEQTGGSKQVKENSGVCPQCGGGNYFARSLTESGMAMRTPAAPRCYDCGYPIVQAGSPRGGANSARRAGPSMHARQLPPGHVVTMLDGSTQISYPPN